MLVNARRKTEVILEEKEKEALRKAAEILQKIGFQAEYSEEYIRVGKNSWDLDIIVDMDVKLRELAEQEILELETPEESEY